MRWVAPNSTLAQPENCAVVVIIAIDYLLSVIIVPSYHHPIRETWLANPIIVILIMLSLVNVIIIVIWLIHLLLIEMVITSISETWLAPLLTTCLVPPTQRGNIPKGTPAPSKHHQAHPNSYAIKI